MNPNPDTARSCGCTKLHWGSAIPFWIIAAAALCAGAWLAVDTVRDFSGFEAIAGAVGIFALMGCFALFAIVRGCMWLHEDCSGCKSDGFLGIGGRR